MEQNQELSMEEMFEKLNTIVEKLESDEILLEDAIQSYEEGISLVKKCNTMIDMTEKKVMVIRENGELDEF